MAAVELRVGEAATAEEIRGFCRGHIASYKVPVQVVFLRPNEFPRTNTGKVEKTGAARGDGGASASSVP